MSCQHSNNDDDDDEYLSLELTHTLARSFAHSITVKKDEEENEDNDMIDSGSD